jgi:hypothetical protein
MGNSKEQGVTGSGNWQPRKLSGTHLRKEKYKETHTSAQYLSEMPTIHGYFFGHVWFGYQ